MEFSQAKHFILNALDLGLSDAMVYHNRNHTESVLRAATEIGINEGVSSESMTLLQTAALYHDSGFLTGMDHHELRSCAIVQNVLPDYGYTHEQIRQICQIIMATKLPQMPTCKLGEILADADLFHLGTGDAYPVAELLLREMQNKGVSRTYEEWTNIQVTFVGNHEYFTAYAYDRLEADKQTYLSDLIEEQRELQHVLAIPA